jgi:hypothetical protein
MAQSIHYRRVHRYIALLALRKGDECSNDCVDGGDRYGDAGSCILTSDDKSGPTNRDLPDRLPFLFYPP